MDAPRVAVLGSLNADLVTVVERFPAPGETIPARSFAIHPGGKGANQAVAAGRLGANVGMFGALGDDALAARLRDSLSAAGVDVGAVMRCEGTPTGTASIWVDAAAENAIAIAAGANGRVDAHYVDRHLNALAGAAVILLQGEIPLNTMRHLLERLPAAARVILDPAPVFDLRALPTDRVWLLTPNEHELAELTGIDTREPAGVRRAAREAMERFGLARLVCKAGARGSYLVEGERFVAVEGLTVEAVDTTAAGDAFNGALAAGLTEGWPLERAVRFANAAAALSVTREGAQPAMPARAEVDGFLRAWRSNGASNGASDHANDGAS